MNHQNTSFQPETEDQDYDKTKQSDWIVAMVVSVILLIVSSWILVSLIHFGRKTGKWKEIQKNNSDKLSGGLVYTSVVFCAAFSILYYLIALVFINIGFDSHNDETCDFVDDIVKCVYGMVVFSVDLFLWFRQRVFYSNRMLNVQFSRSIHVFSSLSILIIFFGGLCGIILSTLPNDVVSTPRGCVYIPDGSYKIIPFFIFVCIILFGQFSLLALFFHALKRSNRPCHSEVPENKSCLTFCKNKHQRNNKSSNLLNRYSSKSLYSTIKSYSIIRSVIKKTFIFACFSSICDIIVLIVTFYVYKPGYVRRISVVIAEGAVFLNLMLVFLSFAQWKKIITSFCKFEQCDNGPPIDFVA